jgi:hypothetical protein
LASVTDWSPFSRSVSPEMTCTLPGVSRSEMPSRLPVMVGALSVLDVTPTTFTDSLTPATCRVMLTLLACSDTLTFWLHR